MRKPAVMLAVAYAISTFAVHADPVITSVSPTTGSVAGGTVVQIRGSGFNTSVVVDFGTSQAMSVKFIDEQTLEVVSPPHFPGTTSITVVDLRHGDPGGPHPEPAILENAFSFTGAIEEGFEALLFPIFSDPVNGSFGSRFETSARVLNQSVRALSVYGVDRRCTAFPTPPEEPELLGPAQDHELPTECSRSTGRLFRVGKSELRDLSASLRVTDVSRTVSTLGVEIPVVKGSDFRERITLFNIPVGPNYRHTLRIYSLSPDSHRVTMRGNSSVPGTPTVFFGATGNLEPGRDIFEPAVAVLSDFPPAWGLGTMSVKITSVAGKPIWAMVSVTNNETQLVTLVTTQP